MYIIGKCYLPSKETNGRDKNKIFTKDYIKKARIDMDLIFCEKYFIIFNLINT